MVCPRKVRAPPAQFRSGAIGNEKPIVITVERWYSPDLQMNVLIKRSDPRTGDNVFQLTNIVNGGAGRIAVPGAIRLHGESRGENGVSPERARPPPPPQ